jgi:hypothetical protein
MTRSEPPVRLRATGAGDLLELLPYLLGFHPTESVVLVVVSDGKLALAARVDLPPRCAVDALTAQLVSIAGSNDADAVLIFVFSGDSDTARELVPRLVDGLGEFDVLDAVYADGRRWSSLLCTDGCCPEDGTPYEPGSGLLAAEAVYAGMSACSSRQELEASVVGPSEAEEAALRELMLVVAAELDLLDRSSRRDLIARRVADLVRVPVDLADGDALQLAVLVADIDVRDVAWALMTREEAAAHVALWRQVVSRTPAELASGPLCLLGMASWISGNGALMVCCMERVLRLDPGYTMAGLLEDINRRAVPPTAWDDIAGPMRSELGLAAGAAFPG